MAHPYCTTTDLQYACGGAEKLLQTFDWDGDGVADTDAMAQAVFEADTLIDGYLNKNYLVPLDVVPPMIKLLSARMAVRMSREARGMIDIESHHRMAEADTKLLEGLRDNTITTGVDPGPTRASARIDQVVERPWSKDVSRRKLWGFR